MKNLTILGSTGSIGQQTLQVVHANADKLKVFAITGNNNIDLLKEQIAEFKPQYAAVLKENHDLLEFAKSYGTKVLFGTNGLCEIATHSDSELILSAIVGIAGLVPTYEAIKQGKTVALANKETLVTAGDIIMPLAIKTGASIITVDSEHSAVMACLNNKPIKKIHLTASGGAFFGKKRIELENATAMDALKHPNWSMGAKITIDSATLANKALEVMEAHHLFGVDYDKISVVVQRESIIHSMVEYIDNSVLAQLAMPDMRLPIQTALFYPDIYPCEIAPMDFTKLKNLTFDTPDTETFRMLPLGIEAGRKKNGYPIVYNAANEIAVSRFINGDIKFLEIEKTVENALSKYKPRQVETIEEVIEIDKEIRCNITT